jgi:hypothetical protein
MMFELLLDAVNCFPNLHTRTDHTVPPGRLVWGGLSQALRARLRSCSPFGTFTHTTICARHRPKLLIALAVLGQSPSNAQQDTEGFHHFKTKGDPPTGL